MSHKTLLHRLFGAGRVPGKFRPALEAEWILLLDEGIGGSVTYRDYRAPGRRFGLRRSWFTGALAATGSGLTGFAYGRRIMALPFDDPRAGGIEVRVEPGGVLLIALKAEDFSPEQSGRIEYRFRTEKAAEFAGHLAVAGGRACFAGGPPGAR